MGSYRHYCPICGSFALESRKYCGICKNYITPATSKEEGIYYLKKSEKIYGDPKHSWDILFDEEIQHNPQFSKAIYNEIIAREKERKQKESLQNSIKQMQARQNPNQPKCPICNSTNVQRISTLKRASHAYLFGLFSNTAKSQFECLNFKYKF